MTAIVAMYGTVSDQLTAGIGDMMGEFAPVIGMLALISIGLLLLGKFIGF